MEGQHHVILMIKGLTVSLEENNCYYPGQLLLGYTSDDLGFQIWQEQKARITLFGVFSLFGVVLTLFKATFGILS